MPSSADRYFHLRVPKTLVFSIVGIALGLLFLEGTGQILLAIRRSVSTPDCNASAVACDNQPFQAEMAAAMQTDLLTGISWIPGTNGEWLTINSMGYRGKEFATAKAAGTLRIVLVGGSAAFGWGVHDGETISDYLRIELTQRLGRAVEVINAAVTGFNSAQELSQLQFRIMQLAPDLVIVYDGYNDLLFGLSPIWQPNYTPPLQRLRQSLAAPRSGRSDAFLARTALAQFIRSAIAHVRAQESSPAAPLGMNPGAIPSYRQNHERMAALAALEGVQLVFVAQPSLAAGDKPLTVDERRYVDAAKQSGAFDVIAESYPAMIASVQAAGDAHRIPVHDATSVFDESAETMYIDTVHLNPAGNRIVARWLAQSIADSYRD